ncbi:sigma-70 family RNA polymerase sigma factor [Pseudonocardia sp. TRM90224]|uniref:sigma-70 family RNA polymerase sigma factor n=1 Tax=Pseudonocardia sp. TRM90224 TaxID=2812678 RepID=UPI001E39CF7B|nr:sigma-70 family RNA polymerase sigma factor [Pseudonocardia sp. TRM90224]
MTELVAGAAAEGELESMLEKHRVELTGYCYRMLGSAFDAEDAVQETMVRAWKSYDKFEGRSSLRSWLYRIATNVSLTMLEGRGKRARPMDFGPAATVETATLGEPHGEATWLQPIPDAWAIPAEGDPAELAVARESIRLAFVAALQHLPARQRAVLILREVLQWSAAETAELLGSTVASVNSALQRARATLADQQPTLAEGGTAVAQDQEELLRRFADAFERYDVESIVTMLHEDAVLSMPPYELWLQGPAEIGKWYVGPGKPCEGSRLVPIMANGMPAFAQYRPNGDGSHEAWALQVLEITDGKITHQNAFLDTATMFPLFGLPLHLEPGEQVTAS